MHSNYALLLERRHLEHKSLVKMLVYLQDVMALLLQIKVNNYDKYTKRVNCLLSMINLHLARWESL